MKSIKPFSFFTPTRIEYGTGKVYQLADEVKGLNSQRPMIITDKGVIKAGILDDIERQLKENKIQYKIFSEVESNPRDTSVHKATDLAKEYKADLMIGVGGGSSMDTAKCVCMLVTNSGKIYDYFGVYKAKNQALPLITIPTTAGTGSEVSIWAVATDTISPILFGIGKPHGVRFALKPTVDIYEVLESYVAWNKGYALVSEGIG